MVVSIHAALAGGDGVADFLLESLTRTVISAGLPVTTKPFRFKLGNSDGAVWYMSGGNGGTNDRLCDSLVFGNGQFPFALSPGLWFGRSGSIMYEIEDISVAAREGGVD